jgi:hypothetical protein
MEPLQETQTTNLLFIDANFELYRTEQDKSGLKSAWSVSNTERAKNKM